MQILVEAAKTRIPKTAGGFISRLREVIIITWVASDTLVASTCEQKQTLYVPFPATMPARDNLASATVVGLSSDGAGPLAWTKMDHTLFCQYKRATPDIVPVLHTSDYSR